MRPHQSAQHTCTALTQIMLMCEKQNTDPREIVTAADGEALAAVSRDKREPAYNRAMAILCRAMVLTVMRSKHEAPRMFASALNHIHAAQQTLSRPELVTIVSWVLHIDEANKIEWREITVDKLLRAIAQQANKAATAMEQQLERQVQPSNENPNYSLVTQSYIEQVETAMARRPGLQCDSCGVSSTTTRLLKCDACGWTWYCSVACQKKGVPLAGM